MFSVPKLDAIQSLYYNSIVFRRTIGLLVEMGIAELSRIGRYGTSSSGSTNVFQELLLNRRFVFFEERGCFRFNKIVFLLVSYVDLVNNLLLTHKSDLLTSLSLPEIVYGYFFIQHFVNAPNSHHSVLPR
jgi:hypothetical protein